MNAAEQATSIEFASKIATVVRLFKAEIADLRADLRPWANDRDTRSLVDPDSIDVGFHFPGVSRGFRCRSFLVQIRFYTDPETQVRRVIGLEVGGFDHRGKCWNFSTIHQWRFTGDAPPDAKAGETLKRCCRKVFDVFSESQDSAAS